MRDLKRHPTESMSQIGESMTRVIQLCLVGAVAAMLVAGLRSGHHSAITVDDVELGSVKLHEPLWIDVPVVSHSSQPVRLLGVRSSCGQGGCVQRST